MPGTVAAVHVTPGQRVARDEVVCVMLAMKIEIALASPLAGTVVAVGCAPGDLVGSRQALVTVQPDGAEGATDGHG
jgi:biotin carboxyl carrier protein